MKMNSKAPDIKRVLIEPNPIHMTQVYKVKVEIQWWIPKEESKRFPISLPSKMSGGQF